MRREWSLSKVTKVFGLNNWKDQMRWEDGGRIRFVQEGQEFGFKQVRCEMSSLI